MLGNRLQPDFCISTCQLHTCCGNLGFVHQQHARYQASLFVSTVPDNTGVHRLCMDCNAFASVRLTLLVSKTLLSCQCFFCHQLCTADSKYDINPLLR